MMPDAKDYVDEAPRMRDEQDFPCDTEAPPPQEPIYATSLAADRARLAQALRDVRHLLPPEGVAVVDRALPGALFADAVSLFESDDESTGARLLN